MIPWFPLVGSETNGPVKALKGKEHPFSSQDQKTEELTQLYRRCVKSASFLGDWSFKQKKVHVFLFPQKRLEAFLFHSFSSRLELKERISLERIQAGINGTIPFSELCLGLQKDRRSFVAVITEAKGLHHLTFLPRLAGGVLDSSPHATQEEIGSSLSLIRAKLANAILDPRYAGVEEYTLSLELAEKIPEEYASEIPWKECIQAGFMVASERMRLGDTRNAFTCAKRLVDLFSKKASYLQEEENILLRQDLLARLIDLCSFYRTSSFPKEGEDDVLREVQLLNYQKEYLALALRIAPSSSEKVTLFLQQGELSLTLAEKKRESVEEMREYRKSASFKEYELAISYFVTAYRLAKRDPELSEQKTLALKKLCLTQGSYLRGQIPEEGQETFESYIDAFAEKCSPLCLKKLSPAEMTLLRKARENAAEYVAACGHFKLAYRLYKVLYDQFKGVKGVDVSKYLQLTTQLGTSEGVVKAREQFFIKIEELNQELERVRVLASASLLDQGASLSSQKKVDERYRAFIIEIFENCRLILDPLEASPYALLAVGSLARQEMCPYSDFELALLIEKEEDLAHFRKVAELFHLLILSLGETKNPFVDDTGIVPQGFSLDPSNNLFYLIGLPEIVAQRQSAQVDDVVQQNVLRSVSFLTGKKELFSQYQVKLQETLSYEDGYWRKTHARSGVENAVKTLEEGILCVDTLDVKRSLLRFSVFAFESLCLYYHIDTSCHTIDKVEALCEQGHFPKILQPLFQEYLEFAFGLRWKTHLHHRKEQDEYTLEPLEKEIVITAYHTLLKPLKDTFINWLGDEQALQDYTFFAIAHFTWAEKLLQEQKICEAFTYVEKAVSLKEDPVYLKLYGQLAFCLGHFAKAKEAWQKSLRFSQEELASFKEEISPQGIAEFPFVDRKKNFSEKMRASFEECVKEEKLLRDLLQLVHEQETIQEAFKAAFQSLKIKTCFPFSEEGSFFSPIDLNEILSHDFVATWEKILTIWLMAILQGELSSENLLSIFNETYCKLTKPYRKKVQRQVLASFSDKLPLLQDFYCEEGCIFSGWATRHSWFKTLHRLLVRENDPNRSGSLVAGLYTPKGYFKKEIEEELFEQGKEFKKTISWGNRSVNQTQGSFFKKNPESPGDEYAVFLLNHLLTGQGSPPGEVLGVVNEQAHVLGASQKVEGEPLHIFLSQYPEALSKVDKKQFSQMVLLALLIDPEDGKADNYIARYTKNSQGEIEKFSIIGIDNDHVFVKPFISKGVIFQEAQLFIKTIIFCFDEMREPLHPEVVEAYQKLNVTAVLEEWLSHLLDYNQRIEALFSEQALNDYWQKEILLPFFMHLDQVLYLHEKMTRLQQALKDGQKVKSHLDLLKMINPKVGSLYEASFLQSPSPLSRFEWLTKDAYRRVKGNSFTLTTTCQIKYYTFKDSLKRMEDFKEKGYTPQEALKVLARMAEGKRLKELAMAPSDSLQEDLGKLLTTPYQEDLLEEIDWAKTPPADIPKILKKFENLPLRKIHLSQCAVLTDAQLLRFVTGCRHPVTEEIEVQKLNLQGCTNLSSKALEAIHKCTRLKKLHLAGTNLEKIELDKQLSALESLNLKDCKKLTSLQIEAPIKKLFLQGCLALQKLHLYCPQLRILPLQDVPSNLTYWASKETPLSEALFPLLKKAQEEKQFLLEGAISEAAMEVFIEAFRANTSLQTLSIHITGKDTSSRKLSKKIDLSGHPTLHSLHLNFPFLEKLQLDRVSCLQVLRIENGLGHAKAASVFQSLTSINTLTEIDLRYSKMQGEQATLLFPLPHLEKLALPSSSLAYKNASNQTLLHLAVQTGNKRRAMNLISQESDLHAQDNEGRTPWQLALEKEDTQMCDLLEKAVEVEKIIFGRQAWNRYFGDVGEPPCLPPDLWEILQSPCVIWPSKKVQETHLLTLIPQTVNNKPVTLNYLAKFIQEPKENGHVTTQGIHLDKLKKDPEEISTGPAHWVLLTKDRLPNTQNKSYVIKCQELQKWAEKSAAFRAAEYRVPKTLEVAISLCMEHVRSGIRFYSDSDPNEKERGTPCEESSSLGLPRLVGPYIDSGLFIYAHDFDNVFLNKLAKSVIDQAGLGVVRAVPGTW